MFKAPRCWHPSGCIYNSNTSFRYHKCRREDYSILQCKVDYVKGMEKEQAKAHNKPN